MSSDRTLQQTIERRILQDPQLSAFGITVEALHGLVTLKGTVASARARLTAHEIARSTPGCRDVLDEIVVEPAGGISDHQITDEIRSALDEHPGITKAAITVQADAGNVTLTGAVATPEEYALAEDVARSARGVRDVHNLLLIDRSAQDDDESLQLEIEAALAAVAELRDRVKVSVGGDMVVLSGQVRDPKHKGLAEEIAQGIRPWRIRNDIAVLGPERVQP